MQTDKIIIYSTPTCHFCHLAKDFFDANNIAYEVRDVTQNQDYIYELVEKSGQRGVPVIDINGQIIIGFDEEEIKKILNLK